MAGLPGHEQVVGLRERLATHQRPLLAATSKGQQAYCQGNCGGHLHVQGHGMPCPFHAAPPDESLLPPVRQKSNLFKPSQIFTLIEHLTAEFSSTPPARAPRRW